MGRHAPSPPTILITDFREVPTWSEFEILRDRFDRARRADGRRRSARLTFDGTTLVAEGRRIDLVYRRVLIADIIARADECRALVRRLRQRPRLHGQHAALQDPAQEGVLRAC